MARIYYGTIVWAPFDDGKGGTKDRPAVIIERNANCNGGGPVLAVATTKSSNLPMPYYHIMVHNSNFHHRVTGLRYPCVAKCNWTRELDQRRIMRKLGDMPDDLLGAISDAFDRIQADPNFDAWQ